ncbi:4a-hydroxytetrahydrobiopterin dehydratase, partial [Thauera aminoaromatica]
MGEEIRALGEDEILASLAAGLPHWRLEAGALVRDYRTGGWKATLMVAGVVGHLAEAAWHHPELELCWDRVRVRLSTHSPRGITARDFALARKIEEVVHWQPAREGGAL